LLLIVFNNVAGTPTQYIICVRPGVGWRTTTDDESCYLSGDTCTCPKVLLVKDAKLMTGP